MLNPTKNDYEPGQLEMQLHPQFGIKGADDKFILQNGLKESWSTETTRHCFSPSHLPMAILMHFTLTIPYALLKMVQMYLRETAVGYLIYA